MTNLVSSMDYTEAARIGGIHNPQAYQLTRRRKP